MILARLSGPSSLLAPISHDRTHTQVNPHISSKEMDGVTFDWILLMVVTDK